jgi:hypothetical protein
MLIFRPDWTFKMVIPVRLVQAFHMIQNLLMIKIHFAVILQESTQ